MLIPHKATGAIAVDIRRLRKKISLLYLTLTCYLKKKKAMIIGDEMDTCIKGSKNIPSIRLENYLLLSVNPIVDFLHIKLLQMKILALEINNGLLNRILMRTWHFVLSCAILLKLCALVHPSSQRVF